ncbi:MAG: HAMP domain-containing histidine kinase [Proteobacteria bacterium]|nr:HAMP domain-containing histidine kinase [Pseudomonadota bacterium]
MKIRTKILLLFTLGAIVPLLTSHFFATRMVAASIRERIAENLSHSAEMAAGRIEDRIMRSIDELSMVVDMIKFENFPTDDLLYLALEIPYRQLPDITVVALLKESGQAKVPPFYKSAEEAAHFKREAVRKEDLIAFAQNVPLKLAVTAEMALGPVYLSSAGTPRMVMAREYPLADKESSWVLAVEKSLSETCELVAAYSRKGGQRARLIDIQGRVICGHTSESSTGLELHPQADRIRKMFESNVSTYVDSDGESVLGVVHQVEVAGWQLLFEQPESLAMEPVQRSLYWTAVWVLVSLGIALGGGAILSKELTRPIVQLEEAAVRIADGDYKLSLDLRSKDEMGRLASAFNRMTAEIRAWNAELTARVEERTRALREAREQIVQTQKLAAVGELGSGVAHEVNNPLAGVIGMAQLLHEEVEPGSELADGLKDIIAGARRVADVVDVLLRFSQSRVSPEMQVMDAGRLVNVAIDMFSSRLKEFGISVETRMGKECRIFACEADLRLAMNHVIDNALRAMPGGGRLEVDVDRVEGGAVQITVSDDGPGMTEEIRTRAFDPFFTTNAPVASSKGLGLPLVHQIVSEHDGRVVLNSTIGEGTRVKIYLPGAARLSRD